MAKLLGIDDDVDRPHAAVPVDVEGGGLAEDVAVDRGLTDASIDLFTRDAGRDASTADVPDGAWRSALFPDDWRPAHAGGRADSMGRILPDFSFAGYHRGDDSPPYGRGTVVRTVSAALGDGRADARVERADRRSCGRREALKWRSSSRSPSRT